MLDDSLQGRTDLDLLVARKDADLFRSVLCDLKFVPAKPPVEVTFPSMEHYYALDEESGSLVHVHAYYRVITGESLSKNYHFPLEEMLLSSTREADSIPVPSRSAELVVFTLRMMVKHTSLLELLMLRRDWEKVPREARWLCRERADEAAVSLARHWMPGLDEQLLRQCIVSLSRPESLLRRIFLGFRLRKYVKCYARRPLVKAWFHRLRMAPLQILGHFGIREKGMTPAPGGAVIAFVGAEASGKSTLLAETARWLGSHFAIGRIHAGKPQPTLLTALPDLLVPLLRRALPSYRPTTIEMTRVPDGGDGPVKRVFPVITGIRAVLLAYERRALLIRAHARAANGRLVLCDRYPSRTDGAPDCPQLQGYQLSRDKHPLRYLLARAERRLYSEIPPPDLVINLSVPMELALARNRTRSKEEPEEYVRRRHTRASAYDFGSTPLVVVSTDRPLESTIREVKKAVWSAL